MGGISGSVVDAVGRTDQVALRWPPRRARPDGLSKVSRYYLAYAQCPVLAIPLSPAFARELRTWPPGLGVPAPATDAWKVLRDSASQPPEKQRASASRAPRSGSEVSDLMGLARGVKMSGERRATACTYLGNPWVGKTFAMLAEGRLRRAGDGRVDRVVWPT
jgi:hypothetical protein